MALPLRGLPTRRTDLAYGESETEHSLEVGQRGYYSVAIRVLPVAVTRASQRMRTSSRK
jgi:hypothetical protein